MATRRGPDGRPAGAHPAEPHAGPGACPDGGTAGPGELYDALLAGLESQSSWPTLGAALAAAEDGNGTAAASMSGRYETGGSTNGADAEQAIDCLDHPVDRDPASYPALAAPVGRSAPVFGPLLAWGLLGLCDLAGPAHPDARTGVGPGGAAHPGGRHHR